MEVAMAILTADPQAHAARGQDDGMNGTISRRHQCPADPRENWCQRQQGEFGDPERGTRASWGDQGRTDGRGRNRCLQNAMTGIPNQGFRWARSTLALGSSDARRSRSPGMFQARAQRALVGKYKARHALQTRMDCGFHRAPVMAKHNEHDAQKGPGAAGIRAAGRRRARGPAAAGAGRPAARQARRCSGRRTGLPGSSAGRHDARKAGAGFVRSPERHVQRGQHGNAVACLDLCRHRECGTWPNRLSTASSGRRASPPSGQPSR